MIHLIFILTGIIVGLMSGMFGIGGGIIIFPIIFFTLTKLLFIPQHLSLSVAAATSLAITIPNLVVATIDYQKEKQIIWKIVLAMVPGLIIGAIASSLFFVHYFNSHVIKLIFVSSTILIAIQIYFTHIGKDSTPNYPTKVASFSAGLFIGTISGLLGIAGGEFSASFLNFHKIKIKDVVGTTSLVGLTVSIFGSLGFIISGAKQAPINLEHSIGFIYLPAVIQICITSLIMVSIGEKFAQKMRASHLKRYFSILVALTGLSMLFF